MSNDPIPPSPQGEHRHAYHQELDDLKTSIVRLGAMVCETIPKGTEVMLGGDLQKAQGLIDADDQIDQLSLEIEEQCYLLIARQAPMAGDLRRIITVTKVVGELERSADLMVNVCKSARRMYGSPLSPKIRGVISAMSGEASKLMRMAIDSFADADESKAAALGDVDDTLDQLNRDMVGAIFEAHSDGHIDLAAAVSLALVARYYERIGDHAVNIGERVVYMVTGWLPEHDAVLRQEHRRSRATSSGQVGEAAGETGGDEESAS